MREENANHHASHGKTKSDLWRKARQQIPNEKVNKNCVDFLSAIVFERLKRACTGGMWYLS